MLWQLKTDASDIDGMQAVLATSQLETATLPVLLPSPSQTQSPVHLPSVLAPALAANNEGQAYLRWKAVIHYMPTAEASAHSPDFAAAKWFRQQMSFKGSGGHNTSDSGKPMDQACVYRNTHDHTCLLWKS